MNERLSRLLKAALELPPEGREELARALLASVEGALSPEELAAVDEAWADEVERRIADAEAGRTRAESWESVRARVLEGLGK